MTGIECRDCRPIRIIDSHFQSVLLTATWHSAEEKEPYESMSRADQKRYKAAMTGYMAGATGNPE